MTDSAQSSAPGPDATPLSDGWRKRAALWGGAVAVALAAIALAKASDLAYRTFSIAFHASPWFALAITPAMFALMAWVSSRRDLHVTRGSGIPQVIAALEQPVAWREAQLSLRVAAWKFALTVGGLLGGASIGREGPTVHIGAGLMQSIGRHFGFTDPRQGARFILAGGAAGIAAAFNAPLAGVVFAIEELSGTFEHRFSGTLLTAVIVGGVVSLALLGNYTYFGHVATAVPSRMEWLAMLVAALACGLLGGAYSRLLLALTLSTAPVIGTLRFRHPVVFAAACGVLLALMGIGYGLGTFGTGYAQASSLLAGHADVGAAFGPVKFVANLLSYLAGIPGGLFSPALAVGAGLGHDIAMLFPHLSPSAIVLVGMCAYLTGVTQAPLTSAVITMEMTDSGAMLLPILAAVLLARGASSLVCKAPVYRALAQRLLVPASATPS